MLRTTRTRVLKQPHFRDLAVAAIPAQTGLPVPFEREVSAPNRTRRNGKLQRFEWDRLGNQWVHFDAFIGDQPDFALGIVACINNANLIAGVRVKAAIAHLEGSI